MRTRSRRQLEATAYHEAGHAVAHVLLQVPFRKATIREGDDYLGRVEGYKLGKTFLEKIETGDLSLRDEDRIRRIVITLLAGHEAEQRFTGRKNSVGAASDHSSVVDFLFRVYSPKATEAYMTFLEIRTEEELNAPGVWKGLQTVAAALLDKKTLTATEIACIFNEARFEEADKRIAGTLAKLQIRHAEPAQAVAVAYKSARATPNAS
jgi:hypothetical protein